MRGNHSENVIPNKRLAFTGMQAPDLLATDDKPVWERLDDRVSSDLVADYWVGMEEIPTNHLPRIEDLTDPQDVLLVTTLARLAGK